MTDYSKLSLSELLELRGKLEAKMESCWDAMDFDGSLEYSRTLVLIQEAINKLPIENYYKGE